MSVLRLVPVPAPDFWVLIVSEKRLVSRLAICLYVFAAMAAGFKQLFAGRFKCLPLFPGHDIHPRTTRGGSPKVHVCCSRSPRVGLMPWKQVVVPEVTLAKENAFIIKSRTTLSSTTIKTGGIRRVCDT